MPTCESSTESHYLLLQKLLNSFLAVITPSKPGQKGLLLVEFISYFNLSLLTVISMSCRFGLHLLQIYKNLAFWDFGGEGFFFFSFLFFWFYFPLILSWDVPPASKEGNLIVVMYQENSNNCRFNCRHALKRCLSILRILIQMLFFRKQLCALLCISRNTDFHTGS